MNEIRINLIFFLKTNVTNYGLIFNASCTRYKYEIDNLQFFASMIDSQE